MAIAENIRAFLRANPPSEEWLRNLGEYLPKVGEITDDAPLVRVQHGASTLAQVSSKDACTEEQLRRFNQWPPDGLWITWGDIAPRIAAPLLAERLDEKLTQEGLETVPEGARVEFFWRRKKEKVVGEFK